MNEVLTKEELNILLQIINSSNFKGDSVRTIALIIEKLESLYIKSEAKKE